MWIVPSKGSYALPLFCPFKTPHTSFISDIPSRDGQQNQPQKNSCLVLPVANASMQAHFRESHGLLTCIQALAKGNSGLWTPALNTLHQFPLRCTWWSLSFSSSVAFLTLFFSLVQLIWTLYQYSQKLCILKRQQIFILSFQAFPSLHWK